MGDKTKIQWADATWNPVVGCTKVSDGCRNCYAFDLHTMRHKAKLEGKQLPEQYAKPFSEIQLFPDRLDQPLRWKRARKIFVNSLSDLFHPDVPDDFIQQLWGTMAAAEWHTFLVLTKRPERMRDWVSKYGNVVGTNQPALRNVWLGVTVENQQAADERIPLLLQTPAAVRWISVEPMVGPVDIDHWTRSDDMGVPIGHEIDWVVCGGESGKNARPMHPEWAQSLRDQCQAAGVPFFFKQHGEWLELQEAARPGRVPVSSLLKDIHTFEDDTEMVRVGTKAAGRMLDGKLWDQYPEEG